MRKYLSRLACAVVALLCMQTARAEAVEKPLLKAFHFTNGVVFYGLSDNGLWAVGHAVNPINTEKCGYPTLVNTRTYEETALSSEADDELPLDFAAFDVSDDCTVCGSYKSVPAVWRDGTWTQLPMPRGWTEGYAQAITPDGHYCVGKGIESYNETPLLWDLQNGGQLVETPNTPVFGSARENDHQVRFTGITPDARYITGIVSYSYPANILYFIYDRETQTWRAPGYEVVNNKYVTPLTDEAQYFDGLLLSPDGRWATGKAMVNETPTPYIYNVETGEYTLYNDEDSRDMTPTAIDNEGTIYAYSPDTPNRTLYVRSGSFWYAMPEILKQRYDMDYYGLTNFPYSGMAAGVSGDGKMMAGMAYVVNDNFLLQMNESFGYAASTINLMRNYVAQPADGTAFSSYNTTSITFTQRVKILNSSACGLYDAEGNLLRAGSLSVASTDPRTVLYQMRTTKLEAGKRYCLKIDAGAFCLEGDETKTNEPIAVWYTGRADTPVQVTSVYPESGSDYALLQRDKAPVILYFDTDIKLSADAKAALYKGDGAEPECDLLMETAVSGERNRLLVYPANGAYLYKGNTYRVVISQGSVTDMQGRNGCDEITVSYNGQYERIVESTDEYVFSEDFSAGLGKMMLYDGDRLQPNEEMASWDFKADTGWGPVMDDDRSNMAAASHSMYATPGRSDDWMATPQLDIKDARCSLKFKSQSYTPGKNDTLKVYVLATDDRINEMTAAVARRFRTEGGLIYCEREDPGQSASTLKDDWKDNSISLAAYAGKRVYIAFVNDNDNQSALFVDDVMVTAQRDFKISLAAPESLLNADDVEIKGQVRVNIDDKTFRGVRLTLLDAAGKAVSAVDAPDAVITKAAPYAFTFADKLPLQHGEEVAYSVAAETEGQRDTLRMTLKNYAFKTTKRVAVEKITGQGCANCPLGILAMHNLESVWGDRILPLEYHVYTGDSFERGMTSYTQAIGASGAAPAAIINRSAAEYAPMSSSTVNDVTTYTFSDPQNPLWYDAVAAELDTPADADLNISATYDADTKQVNAHIETTYALNQRKQNVGLLLIVTEDGLTGFQMNNLYSTDCPTLGDWGKGGLNAKSVVKYTFNDVASQLVGQSYNGLQGLLPTDFTGGQTYTADTQFAIQTQTVSEPMNCKLTCMMLNLTTGKVINCARTKFAASGSGITTVKTDRASEAVYNLSGQRVQTPRKGNIYIVGGRKIVW